MKVHRVVHHGLVVEGEANDISRLDHQQSILLDGLPIDMPHVSIHIAAQSQFHIMNRGILRQSGRLKRL